MSVVLYFLNDIRVTLENRAWGTEPVKMLDRPVGFHVRSGEGDLSRFQSHVDTNQATATAGFQSFIKEQYSQLSENND